MAINWLAIGLTLALLFIFGILYAVMVRWMAKMHIIEGQTATVVVGGVLVTVLGSTVLNGWTATLLTLACFAASGLPMMAEYVMRVASEQKRDRDGADQVAKDLL
jgi:hypothetical protein